MHKSSLKRKTPLISKSTLKQKKCLKSSKNGFTKSNKIRTLEKKRFSIIYNDLSTCCVCGTSKNIELNEIYFGCNRINSMIWGMVAPMCHNCHVKFHNDVKMQLYFKKMFQKKFEESESRDTFLSIFHKNYL